MMPAAFRVTLLAAMAVLADPAAPGAQAPPPAAASESSQGFVSATRFGQRDGAALYAAICAGCHMPDGQGAVGAGQYPPLARNARLESAGYPVSIVVNGLRGMPGFSTQLDDAQIAAVVNWVRTNLGNDYRIDPIRPEDVRAARP